MTYRLIITDGASTIVLNEYRSKVVVDYVKAGIEAELMFRRPGLDLEIIEEQDEVQVPVSH